MINIKVLASGSSGNCYMVSSENINILFDAGIAWRDIQVLSEFKRIDAVFISHSHKDHCKAVESLLRMGIDTYMPESMAIKPYSLVFAIPMGHGSDRKKACKTKSGEYEIIRIRTFDLQHDVDCIGYCVDIGDCRVAYISDSAYCKYTLPGVTHWILECNNSRDILDENVENGTLHPSLRNRIIKSHADIDTVKKMLLANDLSKTQEIILCHLSSDNSDAERFKREIQEITGKVVTLA